jgi:hypothetical protein
MKYSAEHLSNPGSLEMSRGSNKWPAGKTHAVILQMKEKTHGRPAAKRSWSSNKMAVVKTKFRVYENMGMSALSSRLSP